MATAINTSTGLESDHVNVGFAVGKLAKDGYLFDNLRIRGNSISAESMEQVAGPRPIEFHVFLFPEHP